MATQQEFEELIKQVRGTSNPPVVKGTEMRDVIGRAIQAASEIATGAISSLITACEAAVQGKVDTYKSQTQGLIAGYEANLDLLINGDDNHDGYVKKLSDMLWGAGGTAEEPTGGYTKDLEDQANSFLTDIQAKFDSFKVQMKDLIEGPGGYQHWTNEKLSQYLTEVSARLAQYKQDVDDVIEAYSGGIVTIINQYKRETREMIDGYKSDVNTTVNSYKSETNSAISTYESRIENDISTYQTSLNTLVNGFLTRLRQMEIIVEQRELYINPMLIENDNYRLVITG